MSEENVEMVRAVLDAMNRGDSDAMLKDAAPDLELDSTRALGEWRGVHTGRDKAMRAWERFVEPWESVDIEVKELIDAGDQVVSRATATLRVRDGIEVTAAQQLALDVPRRADNTHRPGARDDRRSPRSRRA